MHKNNLPEGARRGGGGLRHAAVLDLLYTTQLESYVVSFRVDLTLLPVAFRIPPNFKGSSGF